MVAEVEAFEPVVCENVGAGVVAVTFVNFPTVLAVGVHLLSDAKSIGAAIRRERVIEPFNGDEIVRTGFFEFFSFSFESVSRRGLAFDAEVDHGTVFGDEAIERVWIGLTDERAARSRVEILGTARGRSDE